MKRLITALMFAILALCGNIALAQDSAPEEKPKGNPADAHHIIISKQTMTLSLYDSNDKLIYAFPCAVGKNYGNKVEPGDMRTPEGLFTIQQIQDASSWGHDFKDGKGYIPNCYGNWFIRLRTPPHSGIGIHGTHDPNSIGKRATEGCIRLNNADLDKLKPLVKLGMPVIILTSEIDTAADNTKTTKTTHSKAIEAYIKARETYNNAKEAYLKAQETMEAAEEAFLRAEEVVNALNMEATTK